MNCSLEQETLLILLKNISNQLKPKFERCTGISLTIRSAVSSLSS